MDQAEERSGFGEMARNRQSAFAVPLVQFVGSNQVAFLKDDWLLGRTL